MRYMIANQQSGERVVLWFALVGGAVVLATLSGVVLFVMVVEAVAERQAANRFSQQD